MHCVVNTGRGKKSCPPPNVLQFFLSIRFELLSEILPTYLIMLYVRDNLIIIIINF